MGNCVINYKLKHCSNCICSHIIYCKLGVWLVEIQYEYVKSFIVMNHYKIDLFYTSVDFCT